MGFFKWLLGLEAKPGEPQPLSDGNFEAEVLNCDLPCFVYCYNLWCASCQVMGGLLNELGPEYIGRAKFFKLDVNKNPSFAVGQNVRSVPTIIQFRDGEVIDQHVGLVPLNYLKEWIDNHI